MAEEKQKCLQEKGTMRVALETKKAGERSRIWEQREDLES